MARWGFECPQKPSVAVLAYIAGLIDGEGSIRFALTGRSQSQRAIQIHVWNSDAAVMNWLVTKIGGVTHLRKQTNPALKPAWQWTASTQRATWLLPLIRPYMIIKAPQADLAISFHRIIEKMRAEHGARLPRGPLPEPLVSIADQMLRLNRKGAR